MRTSIKPLRRFVATGAIALVVGAAGVVITPPPPASATVPTVTGTATCDTATGEWEIAWTVQGDTNPAYVTETATVVTQSRPTTATLVGQSVQGASTVTERERVTVAQTYTQTVAVQWTNHAPGDLVSASGDVVITGTCVVPPPPLVTATHSEEYLSCTTGSRNWESLEAKKGGYWTAEYDFDGSGTIDPSEKSVLPDGTGYDGGPLAGFVNYRIYFTDSLTGTVTVDFHWLPVDPSTLHCVTWGTCTTVGATTTSYDMSAWPVTDIRNTAETSINSEQPRSGFGSLELYTPAGSDKVQYIQPVTPFPLSDLIQMEYETFLTTPGVAMPSLQFRYTSVSKGLTGSSNFGATEPYITYGNAAIQLNAWQHWDMYQGGDGKVWSNKGSTLGIADQAHPVTFKQLDAAVTDIMIDGFVINQGSGNPTVDAYVDNVGFAKKGQSCGLVNFEPAPTVVPPTPTATVIGECVASPGTGAQAVINAANPAPTAPNTVTTAVDIDAYADGDPVPYHTFHLNPGDTVTNYLTPFAEDSGSHTVSLYDGKTLLATVTFDSNCADDVIATPSKQVPNPPTCQNDGSLPTFTAGPHYGVAVSPKGTGPGTFTVTAIANIGYTFAGGKTFSYTMTVDPKLTGAACPVVLAATGQVITNTGTLIGGSLVGGGLFLLFCAAFTAYRKSRMAS